MIERKRHRDLESCTPCSNIQYGANTEYRINNIGGILLQQIFVSL
jgi:hypothetical protein